MTKELIDKDKVIKAIITKEKLILECLGCGHKIHFDMGEDLKFLREVCITAEMEKDDLQ